MPWDPNADWNLWNNAKQYGRATKRAVVGTVAGGVTGAGTGAVVGGGIGAGVGSLAGGVGAGPGALAGAGAGAMSGGIGGSLSGLVSAAMTPSGSSTGSVLVNAVPGGAVSGVSGGVLGPLSGTSATFFAGGSTIAVGQGGAAVAQQTAIPVLTITVSTVDVGVMSAFPSIMYQSGRFDDYEFQGRNRDRLPDRMRPGHTEEDRQINSIIDKFKLSDKQQQAWHDLMGEMKKEAGVQFLSYEKMKEAATAAKAMFK